MKRVVSFTLFLILLLGCAREGVAQSSFWKKVSGPAGAYVTTFTYTASGEVLAGTFKGIFRSPDGGKS